MNFMTNKLVKSAISPICVFRFSSSMPLKANGCHKHLKLKIKASFCYFLLF